MFNPTVEFTGRGMRREATLATAVLTEMLGNLFHKCRFHTF